MKILFVLLVINFILKCTKADCTFSSYDSINSPIFIQQLGNELLFLPNTERTIKFGDLNEIIAFCPSGFKNLKFKTKKVMYQTSNQFDILPYTGNSTKMVLKCIAGETQIKHENKLKYFDNLTCQSSAKSEIYEISSSQHCAEKYYTVGINIQGLPIIFAGICFDLNNMRLKYVHYVATSITPVLSQQINENYDLSTKAEAPAESFFIDEPTAHKLIKNIIGDQADFVTYNYEELYPSNNLSPYISAPLQTATRLNRFLGWSPFIQGNWRSFRNLLKSRSKKFTYDVYLGTSDVVIAPTHDECKSLKELNLEEYSKTVSVPMYVWTYLKSKENPIDQFVVIGVNSPYFEFFPKNETIFCDDICHEIDWFAPMERFRKISTFGYIFCCRLEQVQKRLDGFPVLKKTTSLGNIFDLDVKGNFMKN